MSEVTGVGAKRDCASRGRGTQPVICDSQVHAPDAPHEAIVGGIGREALLREMDGAGVHRCVIVPQAGLGDDFAGNNRAALDLARTDPDRFAVMGRIDFKSRDLERSLRHWKDQPGMLGIRIQLDREPNRSLFLERRIDWFWSTVEEEGLPVMLLAPTMLDRVGELAARFPRLRLIVDHLGLTAFEMFDDITPALAALLPLASLPNVAVKASALPDHVRDPFPFRSLHEPLLRVIDAFGAPRVFWGSDLTRLQRSGRSSKWCTYTQCVRLFSEALPLANEEERAWILGRGIMDWIGWSALATRTPAP